MSADFKLGKDLPTEQLPYSPEKQDATVGWLVREVRFYQQCRGRLTPAFFMDPMCQKLVEAALAFGEAYGRKPTPEELDAAPTVSPEDPATRARIRERLAACLRASAVIGLDVLESELTVWLQARAFQGMVLEAFHRYNSQDLAGAVGLVHDQSREILDIKFLRDATVDPSDYHRLFDSRQEELGDALTFGSPLLDKLLNPAAKKGSLLRKNMTLLLGTVNAGKTRTMLTCLRTNALNGKNGLMMFHEGDEVDIATNLYASLLSKPEAGVFVTPQMVREVLYTSPEGRRLLEMAQEVWRDHICLLPMIRPGLTVEEVMGTVRRKQDEWAATHGGRGFDLIIDDYPALLDTAANAKGNMQERNTRHRVYLQFSQLSAELDCHALVACQGNREASKAVRGKSERGRKRLLVREDMEEAWGPAQTAVNIITVNRDEQMEQDGIVIFSIDKSRSSKTGYAVVCRSRYDAVITHHEALGACYYVGTGSYSAMLPRMLEQYPDQQVPLDVLMAAA